MMNELLSILTHPFKPWQARIAVPISRVCVWLVNLARTIEVYLHEGDALRTNFDHQIDNPTP